MIELKGEKYYSSKEVAKKFGVTMGTIAKWRQDEKLEGYQLSPHKFLFSETNLEKMIKGQNNAI